jgi:hypothetical protein
MQFSEKYFELRAQFNPHAERTDFSGSGISCRAFRFISTYSSVLPVLREVPQHENNGIFAVADEDIAENKSFTYYIFRPDKTTKFRKAIFLLHGLNERSWDKYLAWAFYLAEKTGHPVILFPIAFHMNRSPEAWGNPRIMQPLLAKRFQRHGVGLLSTFANVALSERLTEKPLRFFTSGQQSAADLVKLARQVTLGEHPTFEKGATINVFAYSIGAFLAQILFLANTDGLFSKSRLFLFCGGAFFNEMNGVSKLIMDKEAFRCLRSFYIDELNSAATGSETMAGLMKGTETGQAFLAMLAPNLMKDFREQRFRQIIKNIKAITLSADKVIPADKTGIALGEGADVEILDFNFGYSHETPFPLKNSQQFPQVNEAFGMVFGKAAHFLS